MAMIEFHGGGGILVMGTVQEIRDAIADTATHERGMVAFRFFSTPTLLHLDPGAVADVWPDSAWMGETA